MENLSSSFAIAMRTLFDIMDDQHNGYILLHDIEKRWREAEATKGLPRDFIKFLYQLNSDKITFQLFCQALYNCLLNHRTSNMQKNKSPQSSGPPKPPRSNRVTITNTSETIPPNWTLLPKDQDFGRDPGDGKPMLNFENSQKISRGVNQQQKTPMVKKESRRHTLQNGIDINLFKRIKQLDQEHELLLQGVGMIERVHFWYTRHLHTISEKRKYLNTPGAQWERWTDSQQERFEFQKILIYEINKRLATLMEVWDHGLPLHMNLAVRPNVTNSNTPIVTSNQNETVLNAKLKQQIFVLYDQVQKLRDRISLLEKEKTTLIREIVCLKFQSNPPSMQQINNSSTDEMIF